MALIKYRLGGRTCLDECPFDSKSGIKIGSISCEECDYHEGNIEGAVECSHPKTTGDIK